MTEQDESTWYGELEDHDDITCFCDRPAWPPGLLLWRENPGQYDDVVRFHPSADLSKWVPCPEDDNPRQLRAEATASANVIGMADALHNMGPDYLKQRVQRHDRRITELEDDLARQRDARRRDLCRAAVLELAQPEVHEVADRLCEEWPGSPDDLVTTARGVVEPAAGSGS